MKGTGLTALLPQPRQMASKLVSQTTPTATPSSKGLIPYALSKRKQTTAAAAKRNQKERLTQGKGTSHPTNQEDSDSEGEEGPPSFFSHLDIPRPILPPASNSSSEMSGGGGSMWGEGRCGSVEVAPSAPRPFLLEMPGEGTEGETGLDIMAASMMKGVGETPADDFTAGGVLGGHKGSLPDGEEGPWNKPHPLPSQPMPVHGAGPGLSIDDETVSTDYIP